PCPRPALGVLGDQVHGSAATQSSLDDGAQRGRTATAWPATDQQRATGEPPRAQALLLRQVQQRPGERETGGVAVPDAGRRAVLGCCALLGCSGAVGRSGTVDRRRPTTRRRSTDQR